MLKGDLATTALPAVLQQLAEGTATGCLHVVDGETEARVYLRGGWVYALAVPGQRPQLGARLISSGALAPEALAEALDAQRTELQGWRLGELLVHLGYVDQMVVEAFVTEQVRESLADLLLWRQGSWRFRVNERTREDVAPPVQVDELLAEVDRRNRAWADMLATIHGVDAVPVLSAAGDTTGQLEIDADAWSLLCKVDGSRSIRELAADCGFTLHEAGRVVFTLASAGLVEVEEPESFATLESFTTEVQAAQPAGDPGLAAGRVADALLAESAHASANNVAALISAALAPHPAGRAGNQAPDEVDESVSRVSAALAEVLGPSRSGDDAFAAPPLGGRVMPPRSSSESLPLDPDQLARRDRDAVELAKAQAEAEEVKERDAQVVDLAAVRREQVRREEADRVEAERVEAERVEAERVEAERVETERVEAERLEAERLEADRLEAERAQAERLEADRLEAERAEADRVEADRLEAERAQAERLEADRLEAERAQADRLEAERLEAERAEADRVETERLTAERVAAEQAEADRLEAERAAAEQAEADRLEAERAAAGSLAAQAFFPEAPAAVPASEATAAFADLASAPVDATQEAQPEEEPYEEEPLRVYGQPDTDTASLLRELSFLGHDEPPAAPAPARPSPPRPAPAAPAKKKKGLFGR